MNFMQRFVAIGKRVEWQNMMGDWRPCDESIMWEDFFNYRIVEPKTMKLYPFAYKTSLGVWYPCGFFASLEDARASFCNDTHEVAPINPDGSVEVES